MSISRKKFITSALLGTSGVILLDSLWIEQYFIELNTYFLGNANQHEQNCTIAQISDLHLQKLSKKHRNIAKKINAEKPDLIIFTGDSIDNNENVQELSKFLNLFDKSIIKFAILGNWEYWGNVNLTKLEHVYKENNCTLLINETQQITLKNKLLSITGIDDFVAGNADIKKAMQHYKPGNFHIILNHCPEYTDTIFETLHTQENIDLILSGHTHGGQINIFGYTPFLPQGSGRYKKGWYHNKKLYVSKGIGTSIMPVRFMSRAEVAVFKL